MMTEEGLVVLVRRGLRLLCDALGDERTDPVERIKRQSTAKNRETSNTEVGEVTVIWFQSWASQEGVDVCCLSHPPLQDRKSVV